VNAKAKPATQADICRDLDKDKSEVFFPRRKDISLFTTFDDLEMVICLKPLMLFLFSLGK
jgi:hypothetical protein